MFLAFYARQHVLSLSLSLVLSLTRSAIACNGVSISASDNYSLNQPSAFNTRESLIKQSGNSSTNDRADASSHSEVGSQLVP